MEIWIFLLVVAAVLLWIARSSKKRSAIGRDGYPPTADDDIISIVDPVTDPAAIERSFKSVFAMLPPHQRSALVSYYMKLHRCSSVEAMKIAIDDREKDEQRFR
jgi:hypothetical protein